MIDEDEDLYDDELHEAVRLGDFEAVQQALDDGYLPDTIGLYEWNSLHEAAFHGYSNILKLLLDFEANPNIQDLLDANTALHHACSEKHPDCAKALLNAGADGNLLNNKKETPCDLASDDSCRKILSEHGYVSRKKAIKSILKPAKETRSVSKAKTEIPKLNIASISSQSKPSKVVIETQSNINAPDHPSSPTSVDSGRFSSHIKTSPLKHSWDSSSDSLLRIPSSPVRSIGSSYGSMTSLGSSGCSAADDCSGQFFLSFQYNSKKEEFKIRLWEIRLITLLPPSKMPKDISIHMYVSSLLIPADEYKANPSLKKKSDVFRLHPGEHLPSDTQCLTKSSWGEKEARLEFKSSISLEYNEINKDRVNNSSIKISLNIQRKRSFLSSKKSPNHTDPVLASVEMEMKTAVKRLMKESYDTERHDALGITRQAIPLDGVLSESYAFENRSFNSDPSVHIHITSLSTSTNQITRSSSVGDLKSIKPSQTHSPTKVRDQSQHVIQAISHSQSSSTIDLTSEEGRDSGIDKSGNYSVSSLDSVVSHAPVTNPEVSIRLPSKKSTHRLKSVEVGRNKSSGDDPEVRVAMPQSNSSVYHEFKRKQQQGEKPKVPMTQKTKNKLKTGGRAILTTASTIVRPNTTIVTSLDDEERFMGSPSEKSGHSVEDLFHHRALSSSSLVEVDESPSRVRNRRPKLFLQSSQTSPHRNPSPSRSGLSTKSAHLTLDVDPRDKAVHIELDSIGYSHKSTSIGNTKTETKSTKLREPSSLSATRLQAKQRNNRNSVLRKLVYDETDVDDDGLSAENPCYIND